LIDITYEVKFIQVARFFSILFLHNIKVLESYMYKKNASINV